MIKYFKNWQKVCVMLTRRCNLRCRGCNVIKFQEGYNLTTKEWKKAFDILKSYEVGFVVLFGGEPTLRDDLPELISYLKQLSLPHTIITNSIKMIEDDKYYKRIVQAKPYGLSTSINVLNPKKKQFHDNLKSDYGFQLLQKVQKDLPDIDLVANVAVTKENIKQLPTLVEYFTSLGWWTILTFIHLCNPKESLYWWYRGPRDEIASKLEFKEEDKEIVRKTAQWFLKNYDKLKIHNNRKYFTFWDSYGINQNWKCFDWACPNLNPDGTLMACIDRPLTKPYTIFDLPQKEKEIYENFKQVIKNCPGCFWDHMWETNYYAQKNLSKYGKKRFAHQRS